MVAHIEGGAQAEGAFEDGLLRRISGPKREEVTGEWRKIPKEKVNYLYCSPNTIWVIKSRRIRRAEHVARMGEKREVHTGFWWGNLR